jgi:hypothetical protein
MFLVLLPTGDEIPDKKTSTSGKINIQCHPDIHHYFDVYNFLNHFADNKYYISFIQFYITINLFLLFSRIVYLLFDDNPVIGLSFIAIQCLNLRHT